MTLQKATKTICERYLVSEDAVKRVFRRFREQYKFSAGEVYYMLEFSLRELPGISKERFEEIAVKEVRKNFFQEDRKHEL